MKSIKNLWNNVKVLRALFAALLIAAIGTICLKAQAVPACVSEDSTQSVCYWDAGKQGNGLGSNFYKYYDMYVYEP